MRDLTETYYVWNELDQSKNGFSKEKFKVSKDQLTCRIEESQTQLLIGKQNGLTKQKCYVEIHSEDVVNLTIIDLPGLANGLKKV